MYSRGSQGQERVTTLAQHPSLPSGIEARGKPSDVKTHAYRRHRRRALVARRSHATL